MYVLALLCMPCRWLSVVVCPSALSKRVCKGASKSFAVIKHAAAIQLGLHLVEKSKLDDDSSLALLRRSYSQQLSELR